VGGWHFGNMGEKEAEATLEAAIAGGIRFFDTAVSYQDGGSESRIGKLVVPKYRGDIFLMTKTTAKDKAGALRELDDSLRRLGTDHLDLWQMHSVGTAEDVDRRVENGVIDAFVEAKKAGKTRFIGFTGHRQPAAHLRVLERTDVFETCQMPINVADPGYQSFIVNVLPRLVERNIGVLAMKTLANGGFFGGSEHGKHGPKPRVVPNRITMQEAMHFVWSLPVTVLISGADDAGMMKEKMDLARSFTGLDQAGRDGIIAKVTDMAGREVEFYKA
jgi:aryl-alcohol dehydrogenase-like predicted oxidoreductase